MSRHISTLKRIVTGLLLPLCLIAVVSPVSAQSVDQQKVYKKQVFYYDVNPQKCTASISNVALLGSDNLEKAYNYFVTHGYSAIAASGILGNMMVESGVNPKRLQGDGDTPQPPMKVIQPPDSTLGWGIVQWGTLTYQKQLMEKGGSNVADLGFQLGFLNDQLNGNPSFYKLNELKAATSPSQAADIFEAGFERAGKPVLGQREQNAEQVYAKYGKNGVSASGVTAPIASSSGCSGVTGNGQETRFVNGFTFYLQSDPAWKNYPYGPGGLGANGCGPTSMAMAVTNLTGTPVTPDQAAAYSTSIGDVTPDGSSKWTIAPDLAEHWGLKTAPVSGVTDMSAALQAGNLVALAGQGAAPFTSGGHYILLRGIAADGKWLIADPASTKNSDAEWDPQVIIASYHQGSAYAISK